MAVAHLRRTVHGNPARRGLHRLTRAQKLAGFGGKRAQAAAKHSRRQTNRAKPVKHHHKTHHRPKANRRRRNVAEIISFTLPGANPAKKKKRRKNVAKKRSHHKKRHRTYSSHHHRAHGNPHMMKRRRTRTRHHYRANRRRQRNPSELSVSGFTGNLFSGLWALGGAVGTRMLPQLVLGTKNTGILGYVGNIASAEILAFGSRKFVGRSQGAAVRIGGWVAIGLRLLQDFTPLGQFVQAQLAGAGVGGDTGLGLLVPQSFFSVNYDAQGQVMPSRFAGQIAAAQAARGGARGLGRSSYMRSSYAM